MRPGACPSFIGVDWLAPETGQTERCVVNHSNLVKVT
jgi:hypothetical protein